MPAEKEPTIGEMRANAARMRAILKRRESEAENLPDEEKAEMLAKLRNAVAKIDEAWQRTAQA